MPPPPPPPLFRTVHGTVTQCPCCQEYEVRFREAALTLGRPALDRLHATVGAARDVAQRGPCGWQLRAQTARQVTTFVLRDDDVDELAALLDGTLVMLALDGLLADTLGVHLSATC